MVEVIVITACVAAVVGGILVKLGAKPDEEVVKQNDADRQLLLQVADLESKTYEALTLIAKDIDKLAENCTKLADLLDAALRPPTWNIKEIPATETDPDALELRSSIIRPVIKRITTTGE